MGEPSLLWIKTETTKITGAKRQSAANAAITSKSLFMKITAILLKKSRLKQHTFEAFSQFSIVIIV